MENLNTSEVIHMRQIFFVCKNLKILDLSNFNASKFTSKNEMLSGCENLYHNYFKNINTYSTLSFLWMLYNWINLEFIILFSLGIFKEWIIDVILYGIQEHFSYWIRNEFKLLTIIEELFKKII